MKKNLFALLFSAALLLWGCSLDRYPLTGPSSGTFPASEEEAIAGLLSCYKNLANNVQQYEPFPNRWMDQLTDIGCTRTVLSHWPDYTQSIITSNTSQVKQAYARIYKTAGRVHMVLDKLDIIRDKMDEDTFNQIKIELLCIRAYVYDQGVQLYGDIPFIDHSLSLEDYAYARTPKAPCRSAGRRASGAPAGSAGPPPMPSRPVSAWNGAAMKTQPAVPPGRWRSRTACMT